MFSTGAHTNVATQTAIGAGGSTPPKGSTMDDFNLHHLIREVCDSSTMPDPRSLAAEVARRIPRKLERAALEQALPILVQHHVSRSRSSSPSSHAAAEAHVARATGGRSRKVTGIRDTWRRMLRERIAVSDAGGDWKFLADCTTDDLAAAAAIREQHAARNAARAAQFRDLAELVASHGVGTVGQLPDTVLAARLDVAA